MVKKGILLCSLMTSFLPVFFSNFAGATDDDANKSINVTAGIDQVLKLELPSDIAIRIKPGVSGVIKAYASFNVGTNNKTGFIAKMAINAERESATDEVATSLQHVTESEYTIPSLTSRVNEAEFPNGHWGYSTDYYNYQGLPAINDAELVTVASSETPTNNIRYGFYFGVRVPENQPAGVYTTSIRVMVTANPLPDDSQDPIEP